MSIAARYASMTDISNDRFDYQYSLWLPCIDGATGKWISEDLSVQLAAVKGLEVDFIVRTRSHTIKGRVYRQSAVFVNKQDLDRAART